MFPALTASSITLTPPLEDSHTLDIIASAWGWEGGEEGGVGWVGVGGGGSEGDGRERARVGEIFKRRRLPSSGLPGPHRQKRGSGLKLADDPD